MCENAVLLLGCEIRSEILGDNDRRPQRAGHDRCRNAAVRGKLELVVECPVAGGSDPAAVATLRRPPLHRERRRKTEIVDSRLRQKQRSVPPNQTSGHQPASCRPEIGAGIGAGDVATARGRWIIRTVPRELFVWLRARRDCWGECSRFEFEGWLGFGGCVRRWEFLWKYIGFGSNPAARSASTAML